MEADPKGSGREFEVKGKCTAKLTIPALQLAKRDREIGEVVNTVRNYKSAKVGGLVGGGECVAVGAEIVEKVIDVGRKSRDLGVPVYGEGEEATQIGEGEVRGKALDRRVRESASVPHVEDSSLASGWGGSDEAFNDFAGELGSAEPDITTVSTQAQATVGGGHPCIIIHVCIANVRVGRGGGSGREEEGIKFRDVKSGVVEGGIRAREVRERRVGEDDRVMLQLQERISADDIESGGFRAALGKASKDVNDLSEAMGSDDLGKGRFSEIEEKVDEGRRHAEAAAAAADVVVRDRVKAALDISDEEVEGKAMGLGNRGSRGHGAQGQLAARARDGRLRVVEQAVGVENLKDLSIEDGKEEAHGGFKQGDGAQVVDVGSVRAFGDEGDVAQAPKSGKDLSGTDFVEDELEAEFGIRGGVLDEFDAEV